MRLPQNGNFFRILEHWAIFFLLDFCYLHSNRAIRPSMSRIRSWCCVVLRSKIASKVNLSAIFFHPLRQQPSAFFPEMSTRDKSWKRKRFLRVFWHIFLPPHTPKRAQAAKFKNLDYFNVKMLGCFIDYILRIELKSLKRCKLRESHYFFYS